MVFWFDLLLIDCRRDELDLNPFEDNGHVEGTRDCFSWGGALFGRGRGNFGQYISLVVSGCPVKDLSMPGNWFSLQ